MSKIKNDGLDQYGVGPYEQFVPAGVKGVKMLADFQNSFAIVFSMKFETKLNAVFSTTPEMRH